MVGPKKKKKASTSLPQYKVGEIYHSTIYRDAGRNGHYVVIAAVLSPTQVKVHVITSSSIFAARGSIDAYGLLGGEEAYILMKPDIVSPSQIGASRHMAIPKEVADRLGISL